MAQRVLAAMSGGVDSSAAAALLLKQGYEVIGVTLNVWPSEEDGLRRARTCCSVTDVDDARAVCQKLGIPHYVLNMRDFFHEKVIDYFLGEYLRGRTPNPCIACNEFVKFGALMARARELDADFVATGHYAEIVSLENGALGLKKSRDAHKDQTYVLYTLTQEQLKRLLFPCGGYEKTEIRKFAEEAGLPTWHKADSQDICFIGAEGYENFIAANLPQAVKPGDVVDKNGKKLGEHGGVFHFTVGQRKGLGKYTNERSYVTAIDAQSGRVTVGPEEDLFRREVLAEDVRLSVPDGITEGLRANVKIRYAAKEAPALVAGFDGKTLRIVFDEPQRAPTPGQAAVLYNFDGVVLGGGTITSAC